MMLKDNWSKDDVFFLKKNPLKKKEKNDGLY